MSADRRLLPSPCTFLQVIMKRVEMRVCMQVKADAERFKKFVEERGGATGAWRGDVDRPGT